MLKIETTGEGGSIERAVESLRDNRTVLVPGPAVWGWVADAASEKATSEMINYKGGARRKQPFAILTLAENAIKLFNYHGVKPCVADILSDPKELVSRAGGLNFIRVPVKKDVNLPSSVLHKDNDGNWKIQVFLADGSPWLEEQARLAEQQKIMQVITSFNFHGKPERVWLWEGVLYGALAGAGKILINKDALRPRSKFWGSYTILEAGEGGLSLKRNGNISVDILEKIWGLPIEKTHAKSRNYFGGQLTSRELTPNISRDTLRIEALNKIVSGGNKRVAVI